MGESPCMGPSRTRVAGMGLVKDEVFSTNEKHKTLLLQVEALRSLDHPNICRVLETFEDPQHLYMVLDLCGFYHGLFS